MNTLMKDRIETLLDCHSFQLLTSSDDGELIGGTGLIHGKKVTVIAINPLSTLQENPFEILQDELRLLDYAEHNHLPLVYLADRPGRVAMDRTAIPLSILKTYGDPNGVGSIFYRFATLSGVIPRVAVVFSPIATTLTYPVAECDCVIMTKEAGMSLARPDLEKAMSGEKSPYTEYGGAEMHAEISGTCDILAQTSHQALEYARTFCSLMPSWYGERPENYPAKKPDPDASFPPDTILNDPYTAFDMHQIISSITDQDSFLEHRERYSQELITGLARIGGYSVGIIANNSVQRGGIIFPETCRKMSAFITFCDAFNIPLIFLCDLPGFMIGSQAEQRGIIHHGAFLFSILAQTSVPRFCVIVRKAYTAGLYAMGGTGFKPTRLVAFPNAELTIYGSKVISILAKESGLGEEETQNILEMVRETASPQYYYQSGYIDAIIKPGDLRNEAENFLIDSYAEPITRSEPRRIICL